MSGRHFREVSMEPTYTRAEVLDAIGSLFVNGSGESADRLVLMSSDGRDLGGWGLEPAREHVLERLRELEEARRG